MQYPNFPLFELNQSFPRLNQSLILLASSNQVSFETMFVNFLLYANHPANILFKCGKNKNTEALSSVSLFCLSIADSGERKSTVANIMNVSLNKFAESLVEKYRAEVSERNKELKELNAKDYNLKDIKQPFIFSSAPTIEGVKKSINYGYPFYSIFSSEGGIFWGGYSNSKQNHLKTLGDLSQFKDGFFTADARSTDLTQEKINSGDITKSHSSVSFSLFISQQPVIFEKFLAEETVVTQGFLGRCLLFTSPSLTGTRSYDTFIPEEEKVLATKYIQDNFEAQYKLVKSFGMNGSRRAMSLKESCLKSHAKLWNFFDQFTTYDNFVSEGATFCNRRQEHVFSIATTLQSFRVAQTQEQLEQDNLIRIERGAAVIDYQDPLKDSFEIDQDIFDLSWRLFQYFYGQFVNAVKLHAKQTETKNLPKESQDFFKYLKRALKNKNNSEDESFLSSLEFKINTRLFDGVCRTYRKKENVEKQVSILLTNNYLVQVDEKSFRFSNQNKLDHEEVFPDYFATNDTTPPTTDKENHSSVDEEDTITFTVNNDSFKPQYQDSNNGNIFDKTMQVANVRALKDSLDLREVIKKYTKVVKGNRILCPFHFEKEPDCHIYKNHFHCYACNAHGDVFGLVQQLTGQSFKDVLFSLGGGLNATMNTAFSNDLYNENWREIREQEEKAEKYTKALKASKLYSLSVPVQNATFKYFQGRFGIRSYAKISDSIEQIRIIKSHYHADADRKMPIMIYPIRTNLGTGEIIGCHRTYLNDDLNAKADLPQDCAKQHKRVFGNVSGGAIMIKRNTDDKPETLVIAEGIENAMAAAILFVGKNFGESYDLVSVVNANNFASQDIKFIKSRYKKVIIAADNDKIGILNATNLLDSLKQIDVDVELIKPEIHGKDFNDMLINTLISK